jgi:hypothetical protein
MSPLRKKRLLILAQYGGGDHKRFYSQYCQLMSEGLVRWVIGMAFITPKGSDVLKRLAKNPL